MLLLNETWRLPLKARRTSRRRSLAVRFAQVRRRLAFHRRIAEATGNDLLAYIGNMLSLALRESIVLSSQLPNTHALSLPRHKAILTALLNRDTLGAGQATMVQLEETGDDLSAILSNAVDLA